MITFQTNTGVEIVYIETRWSKVNTFPLLMHAVEKGLLTIKG